MADLTCFDDFFTTDDDNTNSTNANKSVDCIDIFTACIKKLINNEILSKTELDNVKRYINELVDYLNECNDAYRTTTTVIVSDKEYDALLDLLALVDKTNPLLVKIGYAIPDNDVRKDTLPIVMASMNKSKSLDEIKEWMRKKGITPQTVFCITPKYDGLSLLNKVTTENAWTRGDKETGRISDGHFKSIFSKYDQPNVDEILKELDTKTLFTTGEVVIHLNAFAKRLAKVNGGPYESVRSAVIGVLNAPYSATNDNLYRDCVYMRYGLVCDHDLDKNIQLNALNKYFNGWNKVPYKLHTISELTTEYLLEVFTEWREKFDIDGLIIEVNDAKIRATIKPETSTLNPGFARAYKANFEEVKATPCTSITWEVSKQGYIIPVAQLVPVRLDGATVTNVTCNNARNVNDLGIGVGAIVKVKRSGMVIPLITEVVKKATVQLPTECPCCKTPLVWTDSKTHLMCTNENCTDRNVKQISSFFEIMKVDGMRETTCRQIFNAGFDTIEKILTMTKSDMLSLDRFGTSKAENIYNAIQSKLNNVSISQLQHASGFFQSLGSKKLALLEHFVTKPTINEVQLIPGFDVSTATTYVEYYDKFFDWVKTLPITIKVYQPKVINTSGKFFGKSFVFTGIRRKDLEDIIEREGGMISDSINVRTSYLVMKQIGSGSGKEVKAIDLNANKGADIKIIDIPTLEIIVR
jgi:NAD-dependent DNA ligase